MTTRPTLFTAASLYVIFPILLILTVIALFLKAQQFFTENSLKNETKTHQSRQITGLIIFLLLIYLLIYIWLTFLYRNPNTQRTIRLTPFWSCKEAFTFFPFAIRRLGIARQILLNILLIVPLGLLLPLLFTKTKRPFLLTAAITLILSIITEIFQCFTKLGQDEMDDLFNNILDCLLGMAVLATGTKLIRKRTNES